MNFQVSKVPLSKDAGEQGPGEQGQDKVRCEEGGDRRGCMVWQQCRRWGSCCHPQAGRAGRGCQACVEQTPKSGCGPRKRHGHVLETWQGGARVRGLQPPSLSSQSPAGASP